MAPKPTPVFVGDALALDFLNTVVAPEGEPIDFLGDGAGLMNWLERAKLTPPAALKKLRNEAEKAALDEAARQARELRDWFRGFVSERMGHKLLPGDIDVANRLNELLARDNSFSVLVPSPPGGSSEMQVQLVRRYDSPEALLMPIAEVLANLLCEENFSLIRACEGPGCGLLFADHTRRRARRWCSMAMCGNRAKQAAHRSRTKARPDTET